MPHNSPFRILLALSSLLSIATNAGVIVAVSYDIAHPSPGMLLPSVATRIIIACVLSLPFLLVGTSHLLAGVVVGATTRRWPLWVLVISAPLIAFASLFFFALGAPLRVTMPALINVLAQVALFAFCLCEFYAAWATARVPGFEPLVHPAVGGQDDVRAADSRAK